MIACAAIPQFFPQFCGITYYLIEKEQNPAIYLAKMAGFLGIAVKKRAISPFCSLKWRERRLRAIPTGIPDAGIQRIAASLTGWKEDEKLSRIVDHAELKKNEYNISQAGDGERLGNT